MLGPVFQADLRSHSRRPRLIILRIALLNILLCLFVLCYAGLPNSISKKQATVLADFASQFVFLYMIGQFAFLMLIGPTYVAGAIAEERQRGTLDYLFSSNLTNYEIVIGKYFSRLFLLIQFVMIGLPVLALTHMIGGVSPEMVLGMFFGTVGCLAFLTALTLLLSVMSKNARVALARTFFITLALFIVWFLLHRLAHSSLLDSLFPSISGRQVRGVVVQLLYLNPVYIALLLRDQLALAGNIEGLPLRWYGQCLVLHLLIAGVLIVWAKAIVRQRFLKQIDLSIKHGKRATAYRKPDVWSNFPTYWKERYVHGGGYRLFSWMRWLKRDLVPKTSINVVAAVFLFALLFFVAFVFSLAPALLGPLRVSEETAILGVWMALGLLILVHLAVILRTASGIAIEKDRDTWDALIASPIPLSDLLLTRVYGGFLSARWLFLMAVLIVVVLMLLAENRLNYGYHDDRVATLPNVIAFMIANVGFVIFTLGLAAFFSVKSSSSIRNVMSALSVMIVLNLLPIVARTFLGIAGSTNGLVEVLYFLTSPASIPIIVGVGLFAIFSVVAYYKFPKVRWLYSIVIWLGNLLLFNAVLLLIISGFTFAFGGFVSFERMVYFVAPIMLDHAIITEHLLALMFHRWYRSYDDFGPMLFLIGSSVLFTIVGLLLYWWALSRLRRSCGRVEHSRIATRARKRKTTAGA